MSDHRYEFWVPGPPAAKGSMSAYPMKIKREGEPVPGFYSHPLEYLKSMVQWHRDTKYRCLVTHDNPATKKWQRQVALAALSRRPVDMVPWLGPVRVALQFAVPRPKTHITADGKRLRKHAPEYPILHGTKDIDKLTRCILDALTGVFFKDDSQVVETYDTKRYSSTVELDTEVTQPGVKITLQLV